jgi:hypothetical protein
VARSQRFAWFFNALLRATDSASSGSSFPVQGRAIRCWFPRSTRPGSIPGGGELHRHRFSPGIVPVDTSVCTLFWKNPAAFSGEPRAQQRANQQDAGDRQGGLPRLDRHLEFADSHQCDTINLDIEGPRPGRNVQKDARGCVHRNVSRVDFIELIEVRT